MNLKKFNITTLASIFILSISSAFAGIVEDTKITTEIKGALMAESDMPANDIHVETHDGVVELQGTLPTKLQVQKVINIVRDIDGVKKIKDGLKAKNAESVSQYFTDANITLQAKEKIAELATKAQIAKGYELTVETTDQKVHIHGKVAKDTKDNDIKLIKESVSRISGVKSVETDITVK